MNLSIFKFKIKKSRTKVSKYDIERNQEIESIES
jgi:hypothetical protein